MKYPFVETFKSIQGEGHHTGKPMAFFRVQGCSVGKTICNYCDTDFETINPWRGGREMTPAEMYEYGKDFLHWCITGGEPFDYDWQPLFAFFEDNPMLLAPMLHFETSGTIMPSWLPHSKRPDIEMWITVSPKPRWLLDVIHCADEVKVIAGGNGLSAPGNRQVIILQNHDQNTWPTLEQAIEWSESGILVYVQPRNEKFLPDALATAQCYQAVMQHPTLQMSFQMHKYIKVN